MTAQHRQTAIWFTDGDSTWPYFTDLTHEALKEKLEKIYGKTVAQIQDIPEHRRGGRGNQYRCEGAMDFKTGIDYIATNFHPEYWVKVIKPKGTPFKQYTETQTATP